MDAMAASQKFCLKWNNFQNSVTSVFENLRQDEELVDITLCCEGHKIKAHRMMLSACSPYFRDLLKENPCQHPVFFLKDTSYTDLAAVVEFVYKGEVNVLQSQLGSFLKTAEMLQVKGLSGDDEDEIPSRSQAVPSAPERPRVNSTPVRPREPPDEPASPRGKRRRLSGPGSRTGSPGPAPAPAPAAPAAASESDALSVTPATAAAETEPSSRPPLQPPLPPPQPHHQQTPYSSQTPHHAQHQEDNIKIEKVDIADDDDDESLEATLGQVSNMEATQYEGSDHSTSSHDMAGLLSRLSEQGGGGDMSVPGTAGTSEDGSSQGDRFSMCPVPGCGRLLAGTLRRRQHLAWHRGENVCPLCQRRFSSHDNLLTHVWKRHGEDPELQRVVEMMTASPDPQLPPRPL